MTVRNTITALLPGMPDQGRVSGRERSCDGRNAFVPTTVKVLGAAGLIPFVTLAAALWLAPGHADRLSAALVGYGAVILAFMGAVHWGLVMASDLRGSNRRYIFGVLPAITGWLAMMLPAAAALVVLAAAFCAVLTVDLKAVAIGLAPPWYRRLRQPLTVTVVASLMVGATALWMGGA